MRSAGCSLLHFAILPFCHASAGRGLELCSPARFGHFLLRPPHPSFSLRADFYLMKRSLMGSRVLGFLIDTVEKHRPVQRLVLDRPSHGFPVRHCYSNTVRDDSLTLSSVSVMKNSQTMVFHVISYLFGEATCRACLYSRNEKLMIGNLVPN